ncbi:ABC transporter ATP-binding protein [Candidatus Contubernalis alkaliaceticus]|uniref:ABC transporter ATP-binding protein n=1 Tax=Candidatus Contubernalis alkaliaceticus TaxID=338645 RepID=UPI001F4C4F23|nr:ABC transporter ATP-binding protein [Candidatus Contubernalis alkalaceticus]UNC92221.1 ABC transporter ATP-binding protein [Candidatus Contubernalis alkalaceticus]
MALLEVKDLKKAFGSRQAVNGASFSVQEGEIFGLLGPNGAGKSTTLSLICGLLKANSGKIMVDNWDVAKDGAKAKKLIGIVPQEPALYPMLSAKANLGFWGTINGLTSNELEKAIDEVLKVVGLEDRADGKISKYSGGMKRRLNIAAGLIHSPRLLIMDEPTVGIDPQSRNHILETVKHLRERDITVIYTSHYVEEVEYLCDRVAIMDNGQIISEGTLAELLKRGSEYQELTINMNSFSEEIQNTIQTLPGVEKAFSLNEKLKIITSNAEKILPLAFETIVGHGGIVSEIKIHKPNLESLFLKLTGKALRD